MDGTAADCGAFGEAVVFLAHFRDMPDPRQRCKVTYPLDELLVLCLLAVLAGAEGFCDIARLTKPFKRDVCQKSLELGLIV